jgi:hypothetical protein
MSSRSVWVQPEFYAIKETGQVTVPTMRGKERLVLLHQRSMQASSIRGQDQYTGVATSAVVTFGNGEI